MSLLNLMKNYPKTKRSEFFHRSEELTAEEINIAKSFGREYFDGERKFGLGGYYYNPKFFTRVAQDLFNHYELKKDAHILDVGCGKGFMLYDFQRQYPFLSVAGLDISEYCYENCLPSVKPFFKLGSCDYLPYADNTFDLVISIATIHNLDVDGVKRSLREIERVGKGKSFIKVNGYLTDDEKKALKGWNLVANTILHQEEWFQLFDEVGYTGDFEFFTP